MRTIDSKDYWYIAILTVVASMLAWNPISGFFLWTASIISIILYYKARKKELHFERMKFIYGKIKMLNGYLGALENYLEHLEEIEKKETIKKTPRRKTTSRRIKRK